MKKGFFLSINKKISKGDYIDMKDICSTVWKSRKTDDRLGNICGLGGFLKKCLF